MYRLYKIILIVTFSLLSKETIADLQASTNIRWTTEIVNWGCSISSLSSSISVPLGIWSTAGFKKNSTTTPVEFDINLSECSSNTVSVSFSSSGASNDYLALSSDSSATGVGIQLKDSNKNIVSLNSTAEKVSVDSAGNAKIKFFANYIGLQNNITAGTANADTTFTINYD